MSVELFVNFRPVGSYSGRHIESLVAIDIDGTLTKLLRLDFNAAAWLASDQVQWFYKGFTADAETEDVACEEFPEAPLLVALEQHMEPLEAQLAGGEIMLRCETFVEELMTYITELQLEGQDTSYFFPHRGLHSFAKARSGRLTWTP